MIIWINCHPETIKSEDCRPHLHVIGGDCEAVFNLNCPAGPVELRENYGFSRREIRPIEAALTGHLGVLWQAWENIPGTA